MFTRILSFILRPVIKVIRYGALKLMKKFWRPGDNRVPRAATEHLVDEMIVPSGFQFFRDARFRKYALFHKLPVAEHDRIFNEVMVAGVCMVLFCLRFLKTLGRFEGYRFWQEVENYAPKQYQKMLMGFGVDSGNAKLFRELIEMRYSEYEKIIKDVRRVSSVENKEFRELPDEAKFMAGAIRATALGTADHIKRGKLVEDDPLVDVLVDWLLAMHKRIFRFVQNL